MQSDLDILRCPRCGQPCHYTESGKKRGVQCIHCGIKTVPLTIRRTGEGGAKDFYVVMGFFAVAALLGALGGVMVVNGWNPVLTAILIGGVLYIIGKIFSGKYSLCEIEKQQVLHTGRDTSDIEESVYRGEFDRMVVDAIQDLPQYMRERLSSVSVVVEDRPDDLTLKKLKLTSGETLLGIFQGVPLNKKSVWQSGILPEKITVFQKNIEAVCNSREEVRRKIKNVVLHELAHFVGFTEEEIRRMGY